MDPFNKLYNAIMNNQQEQLDDIITFISTPKGQRVQNKLKSFFQKQLKEYKKLYSFFLKDVKYQFEVFADEELYVYGQVFPQQPNIIRINLFPFLLDYYYNNISLEKIFNKIKKGTYDGMEGPLVEHQLAHVLDLNNGLKLTKQNVHGKRWKYYLDVLMNKVSIR